MSSWRPAMRRVLGEVREDNLGDRAAALTYYAVLSLVPALLVVISALGTVGPSATAPLIRNVRQLAPGPARDLVAQLLANLQRQHVAAGLFGLLGVVWSASAYAAAFIRAMNAVYDVPEGRPLRVLLPLRVGLTVLALLLLTGVMGLVIASGVLTSRVGHALGVSQASLAAWQWGKWPLLMALLSLLVALLYWLAPNARQPFRWGTTGGAVAVLTWAAASAGFALYTSHLGSYNRVYGSLAALVTFLIWVWLSNLALLLGAEINAELDRQRAMDNGHPADQEPYMVLRGARNPHSDAL
ncbi:YihY/virulence factor BrkB family protein [Streptacidiphilus sp. P02-A3a]|uniref:YihY/virulence factor BrkB family protein n=1 Tax=Streptacidiphilus sp. P02-A3a TaxID=2704468 RepID=UPI0015F8D62F|nr:YihY/virulence factor BrkB family protein [Streptacidiphilus sp. P02-A3a]QMU67419.1 YihY/virulence factor BrkB family protein [Streptacidiphilus sp. P02-A3a]